MTAKTLTIELGEKNGKLTVRALIQSLERAIAALREMDGEEAARWEIIKVSMRSPLRMTIRNPNSNGDVPARIKALGKLEKSSVSRHGFGEFEMQRAKELASVIPQEVGYIKLKYSGERAVTLTPKFAENVDVAYKAISRYHYEVTTLDGRISQLDLPEGAKPDFRIQNRRTGRSIKCQFDPSRFDEVKACIPGRVRVHGKARYNAAGEPQSMEVYTFTKLRDRTSLPQLEDLHDIDITNGLDSVEYIERLRNGHK